MCGRYTLATPDPAEIRARFELGDTVEIRPRYNVAPGDEVLAATTDRDGRRRGELLRWGLVPSWAKSPQHGLKMINARVETVADRPAFRGSLERFRCLILADGFYEWQRTPDGGKRAFHIYVDQGEPFAFAGLWSIWRGEDGNKLRSCTILTTAANAAVSPLHDRMPVILSREDERVWLDAPRPAPALWDFLRGPPSDRIRLRAVGPAVNDARYDGPECLAPPPEEQQPALF